MTRHIIKDVLPGSIAEEMEIEPGDVLLSINEKEIEDIFDYQYMIDDAEIVVLIEKPGGEQWELEIGKEPDEDLGIVSIRALWMITSPAAINAFSAL